MIRGDSLAFSAASPPFTNRAIIPPLCSQQAPGICNSPSFPGPKPSSLSPSLTGWGALGCTEIPASSWAHRTGQLFPHSRPGGGLHSDESRGSGPARSWGLRGGLSAENTFGTLESESGSTLKKKQNTKQNPESTPEVLGEKIRISSPSDLLIAQDAKTWSKIPGMAVGQGSSFRQRDDYCLQCSIGHCRVTFRKRTACEREGGKKVIQRWAEESNQSVNITRP